MNDTQQILIVDDRKENLIALRQVLRDMGAELVEATSGNQALAATLDHQFALAILDVQMPHMSGYELAELLRDDPNTRHLPIIFLTAHSLDEQSVFMGYESGGIDYIVKPYDPQIMRGKVRQFLEMDRNRRQLREHRDHLEAMVAERTQSLRQEVEQRQRAQERAEHLNSVLRSIRRINQLIVRAGDPAGLIREACQILVETRGYICAWILLGSPGAAPAATALAARQNQAAFEEGMAALQGSWPACHEYLTAQDSDIALLSIDQVCRECPVQEWREAGVAVVTWLKRGEETMGLMGVSVERGGEVTGEEQDLFLEVAGDIAFALHDIRISRQHDLFAEIVANSQEAMALVDRRYRYLKVNPSYLQLVGRGEKEVEGLQVAEVLGEQMFHDIIQGYLDRCLAGETVRFESKRAWRGGEHRVVEAIYSPCRDGGGNIYAVASTIRDVTELRAAEAALESSAEFLVETGRMARVGGWAVYVHDKAVEWTEVTREIHEVDQDYELSLDTALDFFHEQDRPKLAAAMDAALSEGRPYDMELRFTTAKGRHLWTQTRCRPVIKDGEVVKLVGTFQDITERKRAEELLRARMRLMEHGAELPEQEMLQKALDEICAFTGSSIGFFHFLQPDQKTLSMQTWSSRTIGEFCGVEGQGAHYSIDQAGVWGECVRRGEPVIHNDYPCLPHRKGLPPEHVEVKRELTFPIKRGERIVAVLGIGNKESDYTEEDLGVVSFLADVAYEITVRRKAEREREQLIAAIEQSGDTVVITDPQGNILYVNPAFSRVSGYSQQEALGQNPRLLKSGTQGGKFYKELWETITQGRPWQGQLVNKRKDGALYTEEARISPVFDQGGAICNYVAIKTDITDRLRLREERSHLEEQMRQAQKMESIGRLAGGVAHDFNNMLSIITGYAEIASDKVAKHDPLRDDLHQILEAAMRSRDLTRQLLAFARRQTVKPRVVDLNEVLEKSRKMLGRLIGEDIDLRLMPGEGLWPVRLDPAQMDQIIANLAVNARDAISGVGGVIIETANVKLDQEFCANHVGLEPGDYVRLNFSDTGGGMDRETLKQAFEPFFTTKKAGKGTGLGLSTVYGIVRQAGGLVSVYSEPGQGTTFKIYLPRCDEAPRQEAAELGTGRLSGNETVMVVEDEVQILDLCCQVLRRAGYQVISASQAGEALLLAEQHQGDIHLLVTDVVMPSMNGKELKARLEKIKPRVKVLYMSGYTANIIAHRGVLAEGVEFLQKPFATKDLARKVRQLLDRD